MLYIIVNPNSLRPYHTTLGPDSGPICSKILAPRPSPLPTAKFAAIFHDVYITDHHVTAATNDNGLPGGDRYV